MCLTCPGLPQQLHIITSVSSRFYSLGGKMPKEAPASIYLKFMSSSENRHLARLIPKFLVFILIGQHRSRTHPRTSTTVRRIQYFAWSHLGHAFTHMTQKGGVLDFGLLLNASLSQSLVLYMISCFVMRENNTIYKVEIIIS